MACLEIWHCNSTGGYSGVKANENGNANGNGNANDTSNLDATFLRGVQPSDDVGIVIFDTTVPGHYTGRTNHIHVISHLNATLNANNSLSGGAITYVGQMFFDQDLVTVVEATGSYSTNTQELTTNAEDSIFSSEAEGYDPVGEYVLLGDDVSEGIFARIAFGMDASAAYNISAAAFWTENGGVVNQNAGAGMLRCAPPSGAVLFGAAPTGAFPSSATCRESRISSVKCNV